jgi:hypothetical protein
MHRLDVLGDLHYEVFPRGLLMCLLWILEGAARDLAGLPAIPYVQPPWIPGLDLGRSGAVFTRGWERT